MFLNAVILVLQETLEAALLFSVLLVLYRSGSYRRSGLQWVLAGLFAGLSGAWAYAAATPVVSEWFDYVGLEVMNALIQLLILLSLGLLCYVWHYSRENPLTPSLMAVLAALSIMREGSEIILYVNGIMGQPGNISPVLLGGLTGAGIGMSSGVVLYYSLTLFSGCVAFRMAMVLLAFFAGNMAAQAVLLLNQADWLPWTPQLWDTAWLVEEYSVTGQLLYALIGYEANPSMLQGIAYFVAWALVIVSPLFRRGWQSSQAQGLTA